MPAAGAGTDYTHIDTVYRAYSMLYRLYVDDLLGYTHFIGESQPGDDLNFMRFSSTTEVLRDSLVQVVRLTSTEEANVKFINIERLEAGEWKAGQQFPAQGAGYQYVYRDTIYRKDATTYRVRLTDIHNQHFGRDTLVLAGDENYDQPFEMTSFVVARNGAAQQLNWNTSKEFRGDSMLVQRLQNGGWIQFAALPATGAGNYSYTDTTYRPGAVTYRIGMKDVDARVFYSDVQPLDADTNYTQPFVVKGFVVTRDSLTQQLAWNTGKEFRLRHIFVQRKVASGNWNSIDTLIAAGVPRSYAFTDASYSSQPTSYRLVGMDRDGRTFNSAQVDIAADANYAEPFVLSSFTAVRSNLQQQLNWRTSKEFRTKDFSIQRKEENGTWKEIGVKVAAGVPADYTFTDTAYTQLAVTYKLVMADKDARTFNSAEVSVAADPTYTETFKLGTLVVEQQKDKQILNWSTDNEWNIDSFYVERQIIPATNGRVSKDGWEIIAVLPAKGGSSTYAYVDVVAQDKQTAYRITALDKLGRDFTSQNVILTPDLSYRNAFNLKNFTLKAQSAARLLEWSTSSENGAASFEIERSTDSVAWKSIKTITATGNSDVAVNYSFIDEYNTGTIWVYYRLVMIDKDGARNLSNALKMVALITALPDDPQQSTGKVAAFPNPVSNSFKISGFANGVQVEVFNSLGVQVYYNKQYSGGEINASAWPAGMYYIVLNKGRYRLSLIKL
ncbi:T9SS type A sorting domain-containing protein [Chitinophaga sedimenti]|uniref:T9SS type A sorting domain-containing protein n=1 Tax=Chitinophaga sedimenti TaxID=2033606 RepID=UPI0020040BFD|nr:T9SS type A sorting domain-containing protein [Chitinophaga sedimenti]MCK7558096.1 T9SS type A sorting domain-containing protein [Chitinophaga sedimenti]